MERTLSRTQTGVIDKKKGKEKMWNNKYKEDEQRKNDPNNDLLQILTKFLSSNREKKLIY